MTHRWLNRHSESPTAEREVQTDTAYVRYIKAKFEEGAREIREGEGVPHEVAKKRLAKWIKSL